MRRGRSLSNTPDHGAVYAVRRLAQDRGMKRKRNRRRGATRRRAGKIETGGRSAAETPLGEDSSSPAVDSPPSSEEPPDSGGEGAQSADKGSSAADDPPFPADDPARSAARARFNARLEGVLEMHREVRRQTEAWAEKRDPHAPDRTERFVIATVRTRLMLAAAQFAEREELVTPKELACLTLALVRIERADRLAVERERRRAENAPKPKLSSEEHQAKVEAALRKTLAEEFGTPNRTNRLGLPPWYDSWDEFDAARAAEKEGKAWTGKLAGPNDPHWTDDVVAAHLAQLEKDAADAQDTGHVRGAHDEGDARWAHDEDTHEACDESASECECDEDQAPEAPDERDEEREREARAEARWRRLQGRGRPLREHEERDQVPMSIPCEGAAMWAQLW